MTKWLRWKVSKAWEKEADVSALSQGIIDDDMLAMALHVKIHNKTHH